jgi:Zn-dependent peptidase ImmA (M78 family)/transcriptional regulator with XRE-family HTH domain
MRGIQLGGGDTRIAARLRLARERSNLTQQALASAMGFENRQTLAAIEAGDRRLSAEELLRAIEVLGVDLDFFTDSFRLVGEGRFSFRAQRGVAMNLLDQFETQAGRWIATYRELAAREQGAPRALDPVQFTLALTDRSSFEHAEAAANSLNERWSLGAVPATSLAERLERELNALILFVDAPRGISGAASQVPRLNAVLVNRHEPETRRNFDLAHELFHLLTWDSMPPQRVETIDVPQAGKAKRIELLAENFAAALLMPSDAVFERWNSAATHDDLNDRLRDVAAHFHVSGVACKWRLRNLGLLTKADELEIDDARLARAKDSQADVPRAFSERFVTRIARALDAGRLSTKRAASLLSLSVAELRDLLVSYDIEPAFEA